MKWTVYGEGILKVAFLIWVKIYLYYYQRNKNNNKENTQLKIRTWQQINKVWKSASKNNTLYNVIIQCNNTL